VKFVYVKNPTNLHKFWKKFLPDKIFFSNVVNLAWNEPQGSQGFSQGTQVAADLLCALRILCELFVFKNITI